MAGVGVYGVGLFWGIGKRQFFFFEVELEGGTGFVVPVFVFLLGLVVEMD
jgi:hypothetical protein